MRGFLKVLGVVALIVAIPLALFVLGIRSGDRRFIRAISAFQRDVVNPRALETAGTPGSQFAVIEHVGRRTGTAYETPVGAVRDGDGWVISLPYGAEASWARNAVAAGDAYLRVDGERRHVTGIEVVPILRTPLASTDGFAIRLLGIRSALRMRDAAD
ncbi:nitroreductase family deazaflavin-dependent oxidoreductase [Microbacterium sp. 2FI]|uniref:nitroreductase family deazaflavin-dependent oxidoreductase n=1 Tax=Microbacterium sp. 2FI TaxID=2502193 RepID=UPI0010F99E4B|nr:nitroreductase family deazaflavin-dependent oxidoreductase [Microbacterium sp. 2FI]